LPRHANTAKTAKIQATSFSENQQGNAQRSHESDQQFHRSLQRGQGCVAGESTRWLAGGGFKGSADGQTGAPSGTRKAKGL
jgi:hypothetical protein